MRSAAYCTAAERNLGSSREVRYCVHTGLGTDQGVEPSHGGRAEAGLYCTRRDNYRRPSMSIGADCVSVQGMKAVQEEHPWPKLVWEDNCCPSVHTRLSANVISTISE